MKKNSPLTTKEKPKSTCDICGRTETKYAGRDMRYAGLDVCLGCDAIIEKFHLARR